MGASEFAPNALRRGDFSRNNWRNGSSSAAGHLVSARQVQAAGEGDHRSQRRRRPLSSGEVRRRRAGLGAAICRGCIFRTAGIEGGCLAPPARTDQGDRKRAPRAMRTEFFVSILQIQHSFLTPLRRAGASAGPPRRDGAPAPAGPLRPHDGRLHPADGAHADQNARVRAGARRRVHAARRGCLNATSQPPTIRPSCLGAGGRIDRRSQIWQRSSSLARTAMPSRAHGRSREANVRWCSWRHRCASAQVRFGEPAVIW
jgi:hypothetical protein